MSQRKRDDSIRPVARSFGLACRYVTRAMRLRCPVCGKSALFMPVRQTRSFYDWFTPLDGCPRCGYAFVREPGYWLMPVWVIGFGMSTALGFIMATLLKIWLDLTLLWVALTGSAATGLSAFLVARHAKALFIAVDQFFDPEEISAPKNITPK